MSVQTHAATSLILTEDFFGVAANTYFRSLTSEDSRLMRKDAFLGIKAMLKAAGLVTSKEKILSIGLGCNISGQKHISVVLEAPGVKLEAGHYKGELVNIQPVHPTGADKQ